MTTNYALQYRGAAVSIFVHIIALFVGFTILASTFEFPDILRQTAPYRLNLYREGQAIIQPTYWVLALTGFTQIAMAVFLFRAFHDRDTTVLTFALLFGVLTGILQTLGFIRWAVLIPYLAEQMAAPTATTTTREAIALIEGAFNRYAGMAVGEHIANICLGLWTLLLSIAMLRGPLFDSRLAWVGILLLAVSLLRTRPESGEGPNLTGKTMIWAVCLYVLLVLPALI
jgi:intracellular septation protein A